LIDDANLQIVADPHLARETHVLPEARLHRQTITLKLADFSGVARQHFDAARSTFRITAAAVQYVNAGVLNREHELASLFGVKSDGACGGLRLNPWHESPSRKICFGMESEKTLAQLPPERQAPESSTHQRNANRLRSASDQL
jgi:hypothetical protein